MNNKTMIEAHLAELMLETRKVCKTTRNLASRLKKQNKDFTLNDKQKAKLDIEFGCIEKRVQEILEILEECKR